MICPNCGYAAKDNDRFCIKCGSLLKQPEPVEEAVEAPAEAVEAPAEAVEEAVEAPAEAVEEAVEAPAEAVEEAVEEVREIPAEAIEEAEDFDIEPAEPFAAPVEEPIAEPAPVVEPVVEPEPVPAVMPAEEPVKPEPVVCSHVKEAPAETKSVLDKPLSVWGYLWRIVLFSIPIFNIIPLFTMAFSSGINKNSKHFASAVLILMIIGMLICIGLLIFGLIVSDPGSIREALTKLFS